MNTLSRISVVMKTFTVFIGVVITAITDGSIVGIALILAVIAFSVIEKNYK
jgi:hypothetical protein